ncbi:MAG: hypothetical protein HY343_05855 [Lentisphaerae bacterium]|nr:hypothetical protein [Lentisphaerota bacterium]
MLIVAMLHFALSYGMANWTMSIAMAHDDYDTPPFTTQEKAVVTVSVIVNFPLVTMREAGVFHFPIGYLWFVLFIADSFLWATIVAVFLPWLYRKLKRKRITESLQRTRLRRAAEGCRF